MSTEPYTDGDGDIEMQSGIPIRLYQGGYNGAPTVPLPSPSTGQEGDVLTINNGTPAWLPPTGGGGGGIWQLSPPYWLTTTTPCFAVESAPVSPFVVSTSALGTSLSRIQAAADYVVLGSGSGTSISVPLPVTLDGQTFASPRSGYDNSAFDTIFVNDDAPQYMMNLARLVVSGGSTTFVYRILNGTTPNTDANAYFSRAVAGTDMEIRIPSGINTTSSNPTTPYIVGTLSDSRTWEVRATRKSWNN